MKKKAKKQKTEVQKKIVKKDTTPKKGKYSELFDDWKNGTSMSALLKTLDGKIRRRHLKKEFIKLAGGKDQLEALRVAGAGGAAFGGKRGGGRTKEDVAMDDSKVKRVHSSPRWTMESLWLPKLVRIKTGSKDEKGGFANFPWREEKARIFISPKGNKYVEAKPMEQADLIIVVGKGVFENAPIKRLRKLERSTVLKKLEQEKADIKRGEKTQEIRKKIKKEKRAEKKALKAGVPVEKLKKSKRSKKSKKSKKSNRTN